MKKFFLLSILSVASLCLGSSSNIFLNKQINQIKEVSKTYNLVMISEVTESYAELKQRLKLKTKSVFWNQLKDTNLEIDDLMFKFSVRLTNSSSVSSQKRNSSKYKIYLFSSNTSPPQII